MEIGLLVWVFGVVILARKHITVVCLLVLPMGMSMSLVSMFIIVDGVIMTMLILFMITERVHEIVVTPH